MKSKDLRRKPTSRLLLVLAAAVACASGSPDSEEDLRAIEALNQHDIDAVLSSDFDALCGKSARPVR